MFWFLLLIAFVLWLFKRSMLVLKRKGGLKPSNVFPHFGHNTDLFKAIRGLSYKSLKHGGVAKVKIATEVFYGITDPDDFFTVANTCLDKSLLSKFGKNWLGNSLLVAEPTTWKHHRKLLNPAFNQHVLDRFLGVLNDQARKLIQDMAKEVGREPFVPLEYLQKNILETTCLTIMGIDFGEFPLLFNDYINAVDKIYEKMSNRLQKPWLYLDFVYKWSSLKKKEDDDVKILHQTSKMVLDKKFSVRKGVGDKDCNSDTKFIPFMDLLLSLKESTFTEQDIREETDNIVVSAFDTSSQTLFFILVLIGSYPEVQDRIRAELEEIFGDTDRDLEKNDMPKLIYLDAVIKESMRLLPIGPTILRRTDREVKLKNCSIPKNSHCLLLIYGLHRHPIWGPDSEEFKPERWLDPSKLPKNPNAYAAFSLGKRNCFGKNYALMSMRTVLVHFFRNYRVTADYSKIKLKMEIILKIRSGGEISIKSI